MTQAAVPVVHRQRSRRWRTGLSAWLFAVPALLFYVGFLVYPAIASLYFSITNWDGLSPHYDIVGLKNYINMFSDSVVKTATINNIIWMVVTITIPVVLGLVLAVLLNGKVFAKPVLRLVFYAPAVMPLVAIASIWAWLYDPQSGAINAALRAIGLGALAQPWLGQNSTALAAVMVPAIWVRTGFPMLLYLAALQGISAELYEAATVDGASRWQQFWHVTMPGLKSAHYIVVALSVIEAFKVFDLVYAMTYGGPGTTTQVFGTWIYANVFQYYKTGYGMALAVVITIVAIAVSIPYVLSQTREVDS